MSDTHAAPAADAGSVAPVNTTNDDGPISIREAAQALSKRREETEKPPVARAPDGKFASQAEDTAPAVDTDAPAQEQPSVTDQQQDDPAPEPSIDPPRSWTKEEKEAFKALPPEHQQRIADRERAREVEIRRGQNEAAEIRKAAEAERQQAEQARQRYEHGLTNTLQALLSSADSEFADIKTHADVQKLVTDDPLRFIQWQAKQQQIQALQTHAMELQRARTEERQNAFVTWADQQDKLFAEQAKEFADPEKGGEARKEIMSYLTEVRGLSQDELVKLWTGQDMFSIRDARSQLILRDAAKWHAAQKKAAAAARTPVPPVQRPGTASSGKADTQSATIATLEQKLSKATSTREQIAAAAALRAAKRSAAR